MTVKILSIFVAFLENMNFKMDAANHHPRKDIFETIRLFSFPHTYNKPMFAFEFQDKYHDHLSGWRVYDAQAEFKRQGLPNESWRVTRINEKFELCDTYPR